MLNFDKISKIYFSPSGTTEKIVNEISKNFNMNQENYNLLSFDEAKEFNNELVIIGMPVFNGRIPKSACKRLSKMKGNNTKAIVVLNYGNMEYGDALLELTELLKENNFKIIGAAATVSQNSLFNQLGYKRPDEHDLKSINEFSQKIIEKLKNNKENEIFVSGYKPYKEYTTPEFTLNCDENLCTECLDCYYTCPEEAIMENNPLMTKMDNCSRCGTCINVCSEGARSFGGSRYEFEKHNAIEKHMSKKEAEFYF